MNIDPKILIIQEQKKKIVEIEKELKNANEHISYLNSLNMEKDAKICDLEKELKRIKNATSFLGGAGVSSP